MNALVVLSALSALALPAGVVAQDPATAQASCDGRRVTEVLVTPEDPSFLSFPRSLRPLARAVGLHHTTSKEEMIARFLLMEAGDLCTERKRAESERILRLAGRPGPRARCGAVDNLRLALTHSHQEAAVRRTRFVGESPSRDIPASESPMNACFMSESAMMETVEGESPLSADAAAALPENGRITVALIEDNRLVREALTTLLNRSPDIRVIGGDAEGHESILRGLDPDVVLLDLGLENGDSLRLAKKVLKDFPDARVLVMDLLPAYEELSEFVIAGVSGFILKDASLEVVVGTIRAVAAGLKVLPDQMTGTLFSEIARESVTNGGTHDQDSVRMTPREREVIDLVAEGRSNKAIAKDLHISIHTVKSHLRNVMEKLTLHSRLQVAIYAHERDRDS